jgi:thiamine-phosphate pyrophosphorylase
VIAHLISDRLRLARGADDPSQALRCLVKQARYAVEAGVDVIQVRERDLETGVLAGLVTELLRLAKGTPTRILVNDRIDVALACGADGVHLRADSVPAGKVRPIAPPGFTIGQSVHSIEAARAAAGADYVIVGTVWATDSKPSGAPLIGISGFASIARAIHVPALAVGGVTISRAHEIARAGGAGIAAISLFCGGEGDADSCRAVPLIDVVDQLHRSFKTESRG